MFPESFQKLCMLPNVQHAICCNLQIWTCPFFALALLQEKKGMTLLSSDFIFLPIILVFSSAGDQKRTPGHCSHFRWQNKPVIGDCIEFGNLLDPCLTQVGSRGFYWALIDLKAYFYGNIQVKAPAVTVTVKNGQRPVASLFVVNWATNRIETLYFPLHSFPLWDYKTGGDSPSLDAGTKPVLYSKPNWPHDNCMCLH